MSGSGGGERERGRQGSQGRATMLFQEMLFQESGKPLKGFHHKVGRTKSMFLKPLSKRWMDNPSDGSKRESRKTDNRCTKAGAQRKPGD